MEWGEGVATASLDYICFIHVVDSHVISVHVHWSKANCSVWEKAKQPCRAVPTPLCIHHHFISFLWMLIFSDLHIFILYLSIWINPLLLLCFLYIFFSFHCLSPFPSLLCHVGGCLVQKRVNREPSSDIEKANCFECACVSHTVIIRSTQQRPHGIYVPHCQSHSDPRDSLIINSNLNLTSNADPRDNIVVTISIHENPLQVLDLSCFPFAFHALELPAMHFLHNRHSCCL